MPALSRQRLAILGVTGSIGRSTLDVVRGLPDLFEVVAVTAHRDAAGLRQVVDEFAPTVAVLTAEQPDALREVARREDVDTVVLAVVGAAGVHAAMSAVGAGKKLALANKESLVVAGPVLMPLAKSTGARIVPIDSEHSALWQAMCCGRREDVAQVLLTASGGPFRTWPAERLEKATVADALDHPTWDMGAKVTIDSATLFNKALEFIEAAVLFDLPAEQIRVVIHPQSVVHSMVEFRDGSVIAHLSPPDMKTPIQYALTHPDRPAGVSRRMDWCKPFALDFEPPDEKRFPALRLARQAVAAGGTFPTTLNAANEVANEAFRRGILSFGGITRVVQRTMETRVDEVQQAPDLDDLLEEDRRAREVARDLLADGVSD